MRSPILYAVAAIMAVGAFFSQDDRSRAAQPVEATCARTVATPAPLCLEIERKRTVQKPINRLPVPA